MCLKAGGLALLYQSCLPRLLTGALALLVERRLTRCGASCLGLCRQQSFIAIDGPQGIQQRITLLILARHIAAFCALLGANLCQQCLTSFACLLVRGIQRCRKFLRLLQRFLTTLFLALLFAFFFAAALQGCRAVPFVVLALALFLAALPAQCGESDTCHVVLTQPLRCANPTATVGTLAGTRSNLVAPGAPSHCAWPRAADDSPVARRVTV